MPGNIMKVTYFQEGMRVESTGDRLATMTPEPMKIIHKEQDIIASFCVNQVSKKQKMTQ